jgi:hypothetical protein
MYCSVQPVARDFTYTRSSIFAVAAYKKIISTNGAYLAKSQKNGSFQAMLGISLNVQYRTGAVIP